MASLNHLHIYERSKDNKEIYRCIDPLCTHYTQRSLLVGKAIRCGKCFEPAIASQMQLKAGQARNGTKLLTCLEHSKSPKKHEITAVSSMLDDLFKPEGERL